MSFSKPVCIIILVAVVLLVLCEHQSFGMDDETKLKLKNKVVEMFNHAYGAYMKHAFPADELMPLSCKGRYRGSEPNRGDVDDSLGNFTLTLIDSLDTLAVIGDLPEFERAVKLVINHTKFDTDVIVSVFETNIRVVGGLLGGHVLATYLRRRKFAMEWYKDELLGMAKDIGTRLLPAFNTTTGIPYPRINLKKGISPDIQKNYRDTCTACAGTMILEFAALSRLTGDPVFEDKAHKAMDYLWNQRHRTSDLVGTVINIHNGDWIRRESGVGAGIDSYYEYVLKAYILLGDDSYLTRFNKHYDAVKRYISQGPRFIDVHMHRPQASSRNFMDALLAFWPGLQVLKGDIEPAIEVHEMLYQVIQRHNFLPEAFTSDFHIHWGHHPLRPEFVESTYFLYKATGDPHYLEVGEKVMDNLEELARVPCGFAAIKDVTLGTHEDQMDSFVLAETFKYLYLLYAEKSDMLFDVDDYIFTTEAHLLPLSLSRCNSSRPAATRLSREMYTHLQAMDDAARQEDEFGDSDHNTCPNPQVKFRIDYAHNLRANLKDMVDKTSSAPIIQQCPQSSPTGPRLKAVDFVAGNQDQLQQLRDMGIKLMTIADGRIQLLHTAAEAVSPQMAEEGLAFMQEMISLSKTQQQEPQNEPMSIRIVSPLADPDKTISFKAGPAQFGYDLQTRPNVPGKLVVGNPFKMCSSDIVNRAELKNKIVLVERGNCMFVDKARQLQAAGAIGGIVIDHNAGSSSTSQPLFAMSGDSKDDVYIPVLFLYHTEGQELIQMMGENPDLEVLLTAKDDSQDAIDPTTANVKSSSSAEDQIDQSADSTWAQRAVKINTDENVSEKDIINIITLEDGTKQLFFRFDKLKETGKTPVLEDIYEKLMTVLLKETNFKDLANQNHYLTVIIKLLQAAYHGKPINSNTQILFNELANELEFVSSEGGDNEDSTREMTQDESRGQEWLEHGASEPLSVTMNEGDRVKVINSNGVGIKIRAKVAKVPGNVEVVRVAENGRIVGEGLGDSEGDGVIYAQSFVDENDIEESENSNFKFLSLPLTPSASSRNNIPPIDNIDTQGQPDSNGAVDNREEHSSDIRDSSVGAGVAHTSKSAKSTKSECHANSGGVDCDVASAIDNQSEGSEGVDKYERTVNEASVNSASVDTGVDSDRSRRSQDDLRHEGSEKFGAGDTRGKVMTGDDHPDANSKVNIEIGLNGDDLDFASLDELGNPELVEGMKKVLKEQNSKIHQTGAQSSHSQVNKVDEKHETSQGKGNHKPVFEKTVKSLKSKNDEKSLN